MSYNMSWRSVRAIGLCDYSNKLVPHSSLRMQKDYNGAGLYDTGYLVAPGFLDKPNPQNLAFSFKTDPKVIVNPRPDPQTFDAETPYLYYDVTGKDEIVVVNNLSSKEVEAFKTCFGITLKGHPNGVLSLVLPLTYFEIYLDVLGDFSVIVNIADSQMQMKVDGMQKYLINCDTSNLSKVLF